MVTMNTLQPTIALVPGSRRDDSLNVGLARLAAKVMSTRGVRPLVVNLDEYDMPIYDGDCEEAIGVPEAAVRLHDVLVGADAVVFVSPEYNSAPTPLLKNVIDWVTRVSKRPLEGKPVGLMSATPGPGGGVAGLEVLEVIMESLRVELPAAHVPVGNARVRIEKNDPELQVQLEAFTDELVPRSAGIVAP
jgi:NAD(P)H-dependent FMN reductase